MYTDRYMKKIIFILLIIFIGIVSYGFYKQNQTQLCGTGLVSSSFNPMDFISSIFSQNKCVFDYNQNVETRVNLDNSTKKIIEKTKEESKKLVDETKKITDDFMEETNDLVCCKSNGADILKESTISGSYMDDNINYKTVSQNSCDNSDTFDITEYTVVDDLVCGIKDKDRISWEDALTLLYSGEVMGVGQSHDLTVSLTLHDWSSIITRESKIDEIYEVLRSCGEICSSISYATE